MDGPLQRTHNRPGRAREGGIIIGLRNSILTQRADLVVHLTYGVNLVGVTAVHAVSTETELGLKLGWLFFVWQPRVEVRIRLIFVLLGARFAINGDMRAMSFLTPLTFTPRPSFHKLKTLCSASGN